MSATYAHDTDGSFFFCSACCNHWEDDCHASSDKGVCDKCGKEEQVRCEKCNIILSSSNYPTGYHHPRENILDETKAKQLHDDALQADGHGDPWKLGGLIDMCVALLELDPVYEVCLCRSSSARWEFDYANDVFQSTVAALDIFNERLFFLIDKKIKTSVLSVEEIKAVLQKTSAKMILLKYDVDTPVAAPQEFAQFRAAQLKSHDIAVQLQKKIVKTREMKEKLSHVGVVNIKVKDAASHARKLISLLTELWAEDIDEEHGGHNPFTECCELELPCIDN